jgi:flagellar biosynthesis protein FlhA
MRTILEVVTEHAPRLASLNPAGSGPNLDELLAQVRVGLGRAIVQHWFAGEEELRVMGLDSRLERVLMQALGANGALEPGLAENLLAETQRLAQEQEDRGNAPVLVVPHMLRASLSRFLRHHLPHMAVLSSAEIPEERMIRITAVIGGNPA